jgi:hypothetical protein
MDESGVKDAKVEALKDTCSGCSELLVYSWGNNEKRATLKGRECHVLIQGKKRSVMIEFIDNGQREIVSFRALRKVVD